MRCMLFAILLLVAPRGVVALTWDFDDGITWGWTAWENGYTNVRGSLEPLQSEYRAKSSMASGALRPCRVADPPFSCARR